MTLFNEPNREEMEAEALKIAEMGVERVSERPKDSDDRVITELIGFVINKYVKGKFPDTNLSRTFLGTLILLQGLAVINDEQELELFVLKMKEFAYMRMIALSGELDELLGKGGKEDA